MSVWKCNACGGTYSDTMRDGTVYMHACGPLPPDKNGVQLERDNKRDENLQPDKPMRTAGILSEGAGVTAVSDARLSEPAWITTIKARIAKEDEE